jgi:hypothetical protein
MFIKGKTRFNGHHSVSSVELMGKSSHMIENGSVTDSSRVVETRVWLALFGAVN